METTKYASAERANWEEIKHDFKEIRTLDYIQQMVNALPFIAVILNPHRQVVFANETLLEKFGINDINEVLGNRPGEVLNCIHSGDEPGGCGTTKFCKYCGAVNTILKSQKQKSQVKDECRIVAKTNNELIHYDFQVTATPFYWLGGEYTVFTLVDISHAKRRNALEKIFFHDILNKTGSISGFLEIIRGTKDYTKIKEITNLMEGIAHELNDEIIAQRELLSAENNELSLNKSTVNTHDVVLSVVNQMKLHQVAMEKNVVMDSRVIQQKLNTDPVLLKRVLINMVKNALEASPFESTITVGCHNDSDAVVFWVHNPSYMPEEIQYQVFQRSFSTKGANRGLGTYSMKLLGENYLGGNVYFHTNKESGTTFYISLARND